VKRRNAAILVAAAVGLAGLADEASAGTAANQRAAGISAHALLLTLRLPAGAQPSATDPARSDALARSPSAPATPALVDLHRFWWLPGGLQEVSNWIQHHPPHGATGNMGGASATPGGTTSQWTGFGFAPRSGVLSERELIVTVAHARGGGTALRADAQVVWVVARPSSERVPGDVRQIIIVVRRPSVPASAPQRVAAAAQIRAIVSLVNLLPLSQPGVVSCPADVGPFVRLRFLPATGSSPLAEVTADGSGCGLVTFSLRGHSEPALAGGPGLIRRLEAILHAKLG
jgi:hypothetical protein